MSEKTEKDVKEILQEVNETFLTVPEEKMLDALSAWLNLKFRAAAAKPLEATSIAVEGEFYKIGFVEIDETVTSERTISYP